MPANNYLPDVLETTEAEHLAQAVLISGGPQVKRRSVPAPTSFSVSSRTDGSTLSSLRSA
jgi:hypothetical protein